MISSPADPGQIGPHRKTIRSSARRSFRSVSRSLTYRVTRLSSCLAPAGGASQPGPLVLKSSDRLIAFSAPCYFFLEGRFFLAPAGPFRLVSAGPGSGLPASGAMSVIVADASTLSMTFSSRTAA